MVAPTCTCQSNILKFRSTPTLTLKTMILSTKEDNSLILSTKEDNISTKEKNRRRRNQGGRRNNKMIRLCTSSRAFCAS